jgi:hypothetical protein
MQREKWLPPIGLAMKRNATIRRILRESCCRLAPSVIHGVGVFAVRDIPKGIDPFAIGVRYPRNWVAMTPAELKSTPPGLRKLFTALFVPDVAGAFRIPILGANLVDIGAYLNHSGRPNVRTADGHQFMTRRRIRAGEELTVDYTTYGAAEPSRVVRAGKKKKGSLVARGASRPRSRRTR